MRVFRLIKWSQSGKPGRNMENKQQRSDVVPVPRTSLPSWRNAAETVRDNASIQGRCVRQETDTTEHAEVVTRIGMVISRDQWLLCFASFNNIKSNSQSTTYASRPTRLHILYAGKEERKTS